MSGPFPSFTYDELASYPKYVQTEDFPSFEIETRVSLVSFNSLLNPLLLLSPGTSLMIEPIEPHGFDDILTLVFMFACM